MNEEKDKQYVLQTCRDQGIKFIRLWFTDILGSLKSFTIMIEELEGALDEGMGFDDSKHTRTIRLWSTKSKTLSTCRLLVLSACCKKTTLPA